MYIFFTTFVYNCFQQFIPENMERIFIKTNDIAILEGITVKRASEIMRTILDCLQKQNPQKLLIVEYAKYRGVPETMIEKIIKR